MIELSASLGWMFAERPFLERFEAAARAGYRAVEFPFAFAHDLRDLASAAHSARLEVVTFNAGVGDWMAGERGLACHPARRAEFAEELERALEYADALGCRFLTLISGVRPTDFAQADIHWALIQNIRHAAARCATFGRRVLVENVNSRDLPNFFLDKTKTVFDAISAAACENVGIQFDLYHAHMAGEDVATQIDLCLDRIWHVQLADSPGRHEPGTGEMDLRGLLARLRRQGYTGHVTCEFSALHPEAQAVAWLHARLGMEAV